jgi:hypothetical protein
MSHWIVVATSPEGSLNVMLNQNELRLVDAGNDTTIYSFKLPLEQGPVIHIQFLYYDFQLFLGI